MLTVFWKAKLLGLLGWPCLSVDSSEGEEQPTWR